MEFPTIFLLLVLVTSTFSQTTYTAIKTSLNWPDEQLLLTTLFDGQDSIYLFGVDNTTVNKYSIDSDSMEEIATFPQGAAGGGAHFDMEGNIIYVPGFFIGGGPVYRINPLNSSDTDTVAFTDFDVFTSYFGFDPDTGAILSYTNAFFDLTPAPGNISEFNVTTSSSQVVMRLDFPNKVQPPVYGGNGIYHFPSKYSDCSGFPTWPCSYSNHVVSLDVTRRTYNSSSVQYEFGGNFPKVWEEDRILILNNTIAIEVQLNQPLVRVINLSELQVPENSAAVYVPRLKRIYVFGGDGISGVWYFEVTD